MNQRKSLRRIALGSLLSMPLLAGSATAGGNEIVVLSVPPPGSQTSIPSAEVKGFLVGDPGPQTVSEVYLRTRYPGGSYDPPLNFKGAHDPSVLGWAYPVTDWNPVTGVGKFAGRAKFFDIGVNHIEVYLPGDVAGVPSYSQSIHFQAESIDPADIVLNVLPVQRSVDVVDVDSNPGAIEFRLDVINTTLSQTYTVDIVAACELPDGSTVNLPMGGVGIDEVTYSVSPGDFQYTSALDPVGMTFSFPLDEAPFPQPVDEGAYEICVQVYDGTALLYFEQFVSYWVSDRSAKPFRDVTDQLGLDVVTLQGGNRPSPGNSIAVFDYNDDGLQDLFFTNPSSSSTFLPIGNNWPYPGGRNFLMENEGTSHFGDVTAAAGVEGDPTAASYGVAWGDLDADGDSELIVCNRAKAPYIYSNNGNSTFTNVAQTSFGGQTPRWNYVPRLGDYDDDGDLDLYVGCYLKNWSTTWDNVGWGNILYRNEFVEGFLDPLAPGFPIFTEVMNSGTENTGNTLGAVWTDQDRDGKLDLFVHNDFGAASEPNRMYRGLGNGTFTDISAGTGFLVREMSMGAAFADFNNDQLQDLYTTNLGRNSLLLNDGGGSVVQSADGSGAEGAFITEGPHANGVNLDDSWSPLPFDFDLDADLDIYTVGAYLFTSYNLPVPELNPDSVYENDGSANFVKVSEDLGLANAAAGRGVVLIDFDQDGDLDVVSSNENEGVTAMRNDYNPPSGYLRVRPVATRSAPGAFNTVIEAVGASAGHQVRELFAECTGSSQMDGSLTFGMRNDVEAKVRCNWPRGGYSTYFNIPVNQEKLIHETVIQINGAIQKTVPVNTSPEVRVFGEEGAVLVAWVGDPTIPFGFTLPNGEPTETFPIVETMTVLVPDASGKANWTIGMLNASLAGVVVDMEVIELDLGSGTIPMLSGPSRMVISN